MESFLSPPVHRERRSWIKDKNEFVKAVWTTSKNSLVFTLLFIKAKLIRAKQRHPKTQATEWNVRGDSTLDGWKQEIISAFLLFLFLKKYVLACRLSEQTNAFGIFQTNEGFQSLVRLMKQHPRDARPSCNPPGSDAKSDLTRIANAKDTDTFIVL